MEPESREFKIQRGVRFFAYTAAAGWIVGLSAALFILAQESLAHSGFFLALLLPTLGCVAACLVVNVYRLRIDERGVHVRTLRGWDSWTWDEFASGDVEQDREASSFVNPSRPFLRRTLRVALFEEGLDILGAIGAHWQPPPIEVPDTLDIRDRFFSPREARWRFTNEGVEVTDRTGERTYAWSDLTGVVLHFPSVYHQRFTRAEFGFSDETVSLGSLKGGATKTWIGADAEVIEAFVRQHVDEERIRVRTRYGPLADMEDFEEHVTFVALQMRRLVFIAPVLAVLLTAMPSWCIMMGVGVGPVEALIISAAAVGAPFSILFCWLGRRDWRRELEKLEEWRQESETAHEVESAHRR